MPHTVMFENKNPGKQRHAVRFVSVCRLCPNYLPEADTIFLVPLSRTYRWFFVGEMREHI